MSLSIHSHMEGSEIILDLDGMITLGAGSVTLREELSAVLAGEVQGIVLNCAAVELIDSSGLAEIVSAHVQAQKLGRRLVFRNIEPRLRAVLDATRLSTVLHLETSPQPQ